MLQVTWEPTKVHKARIKDDVDTWCKKKEKPYKTIDSFLWLLLLLTLIYVFYFQCNMLCLHLLIISSM